MKRVVALLFLGHMLASCTQPSSEGAAQQPAASVEPESTGTFRLPVEGNLEAVPAAIPPGIMIMPDSTENYPASGALNAELLEEPLPCPVQAREAGITGQRKATAFLDLDEKGTVYSVSLVGGSDAYGFSEAAVEVLTQLRYRPTGDTVAKAVLVRFDCGPSAK